MVSEGVRQTRGEGRMQKRKRKTERRAQQIWRTSQVRFALLLAGGCLEGRWRAKRHAETGS